MAAASTATRSSQVTTIDTWPSCRYRLRMYVEGPVTGIAEGCERVLRSLPQWFGVEEALVMSMTSSACPPLSVGLPGLLPVLAP